MSLIVRSLKPGFIRHCRENSTAFFASFRKKYGRNTGTDSSAGAITLDNAFKLYNLEKEPQCSVSLTKSEALKIYKKMRTIRTVETACARLYEQKIIRGFCHLYDGQEACGVGVHTAMRSQDTIITSYRAHGWAYLMHNDVYPVIAELCQKQSGCSRGKGGSMHTYGNRFFGGNGIVGGQVPLGVGIGLSHAYKSDGGINFALYGDGAANQGQIHEVFNIACLWKLPVVFVCENNKYAMGTSGKRSTCSTDYYTRGDYIPGLWVNGMDVLAVYSATQFAINHVIANGPLVMELETYRYHGHSMSDPGTSYRSREEIQSVRQKSDPIMMFKNTLLKHNILTEEDIKKIDDETKTEVDNAVEKAKKDTEPNVKELTYDIYYTNLDPTIRGPVMKNLSHNITGKTLLPLGTPKATPKSQMKEISKNEPPKKDDKSKA